MSNTEEDTQLPPNVPAAAEVAICRICFDHEGDLIAPCACRGSIQHVHFECLHKWILPHFTATTPPDAPWEVCNMCKQPYNQATQLYVIKICTQAVLAVVDECCKELYDHAEHPQQTEEFVQEFSAKLLGYQAILHRLTQHSERFLQQHPATQSQLPALAVLHQQRTAVPSEQGPAVQLQQGPAVPPEQGPAVPPDLQSVPPQQQEPAVPPPQGPAAPLQQVPAIPLHQGPTVQLEQTSAVSSEQELGLPQQEAAHEPSEPAQGPTSGTQQGSANAPPAAQQPSIQAQVQRLIDDQKQLVELSERLRQTAIQLAGRLREVAEQPTWPSLWQMNCRQRNGIHKLYYKALNKHVFTSRLSKLLPLLMQISWLGPFERGSDGITAAGLAGLDFNETPEPGHGQFVPGLASSPLAGLVNSARAAMGSASRTGPALNTRAPHAGHVTNLGLGRSARAGMITWGFESTACAVVARSAPGRLETAVLFASAVVFARAGHAPWTRARVWLGLWAERLAENLVLMGMPGVLTIPLYGARYVHLVGANWAGHSLLGIRLLHLVFPHWKLLQGAHTNTRNALISNLANRPRVFKMLIWVPRKVWQLVRCRSALAH